MIDRQLQTQLLVRAGQLLLEYNESTAAIIESLESTARSLTDAPCRVVISYLSIAVSLGDDPPVLRTVKELRLNAAVQAGIHEVLAQVRAGRIDAAAALARLGAVERDTPRHSRWFTALLLAAGAGSFARLLGADAAAIGVAGASTGLGLLVRQELGRRHVGLLSLPFTAACLGAIIGGIAIRLGGTRSPELVVLVPALMIVPGPHLLNGLFDLVDNHLPMSLCRLGLALGILLASAVGIIIGIRLTLPTDGFPEQSPAGRELNLFSYMVLAAVATCGFAAFFNTPWRQLRMAALGGMAGHGLRYLALALALPLEVATFFGGLVVGAVSARLAHSTRAPVAVIAFAGAVTMIPGTSFYRALGGALRLARLTDSSDPTLAASTLSHAAEGCVVVGGLAVGLLLGSRAVLWWNSLRNRRSREPRHAATTAE